MAKNKGKLRVYLGMSAGVGKTYSMLADAKLELSRGIDVVIGYVERHGREETESLIADFEQIPNLKSNISGKDYSEFDLDAALLRNPSVILVDELAHTNVLGSRNKKRYQDILELINAGIDVRTTLNVQHLESQNLIIRQISGVAVQETVPDSILLGDVEIEVVDIPPIDLIQRLKEGKVYKDSKIPHALDNFFREDNLTALRELLLRLSANRVESDLLKFKSNTRKNIVAGSKERILVCIAPDAVSSDVVRAAYKLCAAVKGDLIALSVESGKYSELSREKRVYSEEALRIAQSLGAKTITRIGNDIVSEILDVSRSENITQVFLGRPPAPKFIMKKMGIIDAVIKEGIEADIHLVKTDIRSLTNTYKFKKVINNSSYVQLAFSISIIFLITILFLPFRDNVENINVIMAYIMTVSYIAFKSSRNIALLSSAASVLAFDFFYVPPFYTFTFVDIRYLFVFFTMLTVSVIISILTSKLKTHSKLLKEKEERTSILFSLSTHVSSARSFRELQKAVSKYSKNFLGVESLLCYASINKNNSVDLVNDNQLNEEDKAVVNWVYKNTKPAGAGTDTLSGSKGYFLPIVFSKTTQGVLAIFNNSKNLTSIQEWVINSFVDVLGISIDRLNKENEVIQLNNKLSDEKLRTTFLSSISHDLRTPLSSIQGAAGLMADMTGNEIDQVKILANTIESESLKLSNIIRNVLDLTKVRSEGFQINGNWVEIEDLINSAVSRLKLLIMDRKINVSVGRDVPLLFADELLVEQLIVNLIENSLKYAPSDGYTNIDVELAKSNVIMSIYDTCDGGLVDLASQENKSFGYGLGYQICSAIMIAHKGTFEVVELANGLTKVVCAFPAKSYEHGDLSE